MEVLKMLWTIAAEVLKVLGRIADNGSFAALVGAFAGAVATYVVVAYTDRRRKRHAVTSRLPELMREVAVAAEQRADAITGLLEAITKHNVMYFPYSLRFPIAEIADLRRDAEEFLTKDQKWALLELLFNMEVAEEETAKLRTLVDRHGAIPKAERTPSNIEALDIEIQRACISIRDTSRRSKRTAEALLNNNLASLDSPPSDESRQNPKRPLRDNW